MIWKRYCLCAHVSHTDGTEHPVSIAVSEENIVRVGWIRGAPYEVCLECSRTHLAKES